MKKGLLFCIFLLLISCIGCASGKDITSKHYLPEWQNHLFTFPAPSESSGGGWVVQSAKGVATGVKEVTRLPFSLAGNTALNAYYIPTWPFRWWIRGDKRLIVWYPLFETGQKTGSRYFTKEWNQDLV